MPAAAMICRANGSAISRQRLSSRSRRRGTQRPHGWIIPYTGLWMDAHHTVVWTKQNRGRAYRSHGSGARMTPTWLGSGRTAFFDREHPGGGEARGSSVVGGVSGRALLPAKLATSGVRARGVIFGLSEEVSEVRYRRDVAVEAGWKYIRNRMWRWHQTRCTRSDGVVRD